MLSPSMKNDVVTTKIIKYTLYKTWIFWITQGMEIVKASIGYLMAKSGIWVRRLVGESAAE